MAGDVRFDLRKFDRFSNQIDRGLKSSAPGPLRKAINQWAAVYRSFAKLRFTKFSRGGGDWAPLKPATVAAKAQKRKSKVRSMTKGTGGIGVAILIDTGLLSGALQPEFRGAPGALEKAIPFGVRVGYGGPATYPGGITTIADIASFHQQGRGNLPERKIIVKPDNKTLLRMSQLLANALKGMIRG